jgi:hypothetical protein
LLIIPKSPSSFLLLLQMLYFDYNSMQYSPPEELSQLSNLELLDISNSNLCGPTLPTSWKFLTKLRTLDISCSSNRNYYGGGDGGSSGNRTIPSSWGMMGALEHLKAVGAGLTGTLDMLPLGNGSLSKLAMLLLDNNFGLSGTLPASWAQLQLQVLSLSNTIVQGSMPAVWGEAGANNTLRSTLQQLYLHRTRVTGEIPVSWYSGFVNVTAFTIWGSWEVCGPHPVAPSGLGALCLDSTNARLGECVDVIQEAQLLFMHNIVTAFCCGLPYFSTQLAILHTMQQNSFRARLRALVGNMA